MSKTPEADGYASIFSKELNQSQRRYLKMQVYYYYPFLRKYYEVLHNTAQPDQDFTASSIGDLKGLLSYYANAFVFGEFDIDQEQAHIDTLFATINKRIPTEELKAQFQYINDGGFLKSDGYTDDYFFGSISCRELYKRRLPGGPDYSLGISGGVMALSHRQNVGILSPLAKYIAGRRKGDPVSIWGNVARGTVEAAAICSVIERTSGNATLHLFRASTHVFNDQQAFSLGEQPTHKSWAIGVDTLSAGGPSVPLMADFLNSLEPLRASLYITSGGQHWETRMPIQHRSPFGRQIGIGTLLKVPLGENTIRPILPYSASSFNS